MWPACSRTPPSGPAAPPPRRSSPGPAGGAHHPACAATATTSRNQPRRSRSRCRQTRGPRSRGGRARPTRSPRALRAAHRDYHLGEPRPEEWLLVQWPPEEKGPTKYWLSTLPEDIPFDRLVALAKLRWRIERDYQELKQELGLGHYEGRSWRGFHHHAILCIAAYAFLVAERATISPSGREAAQRTTSRLPAGYRPRGAPDQAGASRAELDRDRATTAYNRLGPQP